MSAGRLELVPEDQNETENGTYILKSNGFPVPPERVSVGERNAIALAYFFASTFKGRTEKDRYSFPSLYIIDDPISSFDQDNRAGILSFINAQFSAIIKGNDSSKILVLSHDLMTVDNLQVLHDRIIKESESGQNMDYILELRNKEIYKTKRGFNNYQSLLKAIFDFAKCDNPEESTGNIGNELRQLLESYSQFIYNSSFDYILSNYAVLKSVPKEYHNYYQKLSARLVMNSSSHSSIKLDALSGYRELFTRTELQRIARAVLIFIKYTTPLHLKFLLKEGNRYDNEALNTISSWETMIPNIN